MTQNAPRVNWEREFDFRDFDANTVKLPTSDMRKLPAAMHNSTMEYTPGSSGWRLASENTFKSYRNGIAVSKDEVTQNP